MTRYSNKFALATAVLSMAEFATATTTPAPTTRAPTRKPTSAPTRKPTSKPTSKPTASPTAYEGSDEWYANSLNGKLCSKDCATGGTDNDCAGINHATATWQETFADARTCCQSKFSYLDTDYCEDRSVSDEKDGTEKYYADYSSKSCKVDDDVALGPFNAGTLYADAAACCAGALGWIQKDFCESRSTNGAGHTDKWYLDSTNMVCKKDCPAADGDECELTTDGSSSNTLYADARACCQGKLGWMDTDTCETVSTTGVAPGSVATDKYYADYSASPARCVKDCDTSDPACGGILSNVWGVQMFEDVQSCCADKFGAIDENLCAALTTGTHTGKWYVTTNNKCAKDCPEAADSPCGGTPSNLWLQLFEDAEACCTNKVGWAADYCIASSNNIAPTGTGKFYADYKSRTCKKDCEVDDASPECGGILANTVGEALFEDVDDCCKAKFGWVDTDLCARLSVGEHTSLFYVDYQDNSCKQDCPTGTADTNCGGIPPDMSVQLFQTAETCCAAKLSYINQDLCKCKSETGAACPASGNEKWYVDWQVSKCVKNCEKGGDTECGGLAETWEPADYSDWQSCCGDKLSWMKSEECHL